MITKVVFLIWLLSVVAIPILIARVGHKYYFQRFKETEIPYITLDVQGKPLNMIVDSGCAVCLINKPALEGLEYEDSGMAIALSALTSDHVDSTSVKISIKIGGKTIGEDFFIQDLEDMGNFKKMHGIEIHGLLGSHFFDTYNCSIDYKKHCLIVK